MINRLFVIFTALLMWPSVTVLAEEPLTLEEQKVIFLQDLGSGESMLENLSNYMTAKEIPGHIQKYVGGEMKPHYEELDRIRRQLKQEKMFDPAAAKQLKKNVRSLMRALVPTDLKEQDKKDYAYQLSPPDFARGVTGYALKQQASPDKLLPIGKIARELLQVKKDRQPVEAALREITGRRNLLEEFVADVKAKLARKGFEISRDSVRKAVLATLAQEEAYWSSLLKTIE